MRPLTILCYLAIVFIPIACTQSLGLSDFTPINSFTDGIEGPATDKDGNIYAVNYKEQGTIGKVTPSGKASVFVKLPNKSIGNGIQFGPNGQMFVADYTNHNILKINPKTKQIAIYAHEENANQPNDLAISKNDVIYASDPNWSDNTGNLWRVTKDNGFELLESNMGTTNGIAVSPDSKSLFVNESVQRNIWQYDLDELGQISNKRLFQKFDDFGLDGMRFHEDGSLFICRYGKGTVLRLSSTGTKLAEYKIQGQNPTNITFSNDYKFCFITVADRGCIEKIEL